MKVRAQVGRLLPVQLNVNVANFTHGGLNVHSNLLRLSRDVRGTGGGGRSGGMGIYVLPLTRYTATTRKTLCIKAGRCVRHFNV